MYDALRWALQFLYRWKLNRKIKIFLGMGKKGMCHFDLILWIFPEICLKKKRIFHSLALEGTYPYPILFPAAMFILPSLHSSRVRSNKTWMAFFLQFTVYLCLKFTFTSSLWELLGQRNFIANYYYYWHVKSEYKTILTPIIRM